ncbi:MAG: hypothetical protein AAB969_01890 [Patescibacteria group bacterium]
MSYLFKLHLLEPNTNNIDTVIVMGIVFKISLLIFIVSEIIRYLFFKLTNRKIIIRIKYKIAISLGIIIILFLLAISSLSWAQLSNKNDWGFFILLLLFFAGLSSFSTLIYFSIDPLISFIKNTLHNLNSDQ